MLCCGALGIPPKKLYKVASPTSMRNNSKLGQKVASQVMESTSNQAALGRPASWLRYQVHKAVKRGRVLYITFVLSSKLNVVCSHAVRMHFG
jgi:hypothetical protein